MHYKIIVVDEKRAMAGGVNISNRYNDMPESPAWLDFALFVEGESVKELAAFCQRAWKGFSGVNENMAIVKTDTDILQPAEHSSEVRIRRNDWVRRKNEISATYVEMLRHAHSDITILCSYFLPGKIMRNQIKFAIKRGVSIRLIAAGTSDIKLAKLAERWLYDWLLRQGVEIYEYRENVLHGKMAVSDDHWMTIGSYNINNISAYASLELNLDVRDPEFVKHTRLELEKIISDDCTPITQAYQNKTKNMINQFARWLSYECVRVLIYLFTFYFKHPD